jgi:hypothetical protein
LFFDVVEIGLEAPLNHDSRASVVVRDPVAPLNHDEHASLEVRSLLAV